MGRPARSEESTSAIFEIGNQNAYIKHKPAGIDNHLYANSCLKSENCMQQFPGKVQCEGVEGNGVGAVFDAESNAVDINNGPTNTADEGKD
jgi:hypothetical protein